MITKKETVLLKHLRENSRKSLVSISKETDIPVSTLFDVLKRLESNIIIKHVSLVDFSKIGYGLKVNFVIKSRNKQGLREFLEKHASINSLSSLINGYDFYAEGIFKDLKEMTDFKEEIEQFGIEKIDEIFIIDEIKREGFVHA
jgi:DNA-binding Lrp family transcriptional regulator